MKRLASGLLCAVALLNAITVAFAPARSGPLVTTYAASSSVVSALDLAAGLALVAAGIFTWRERSGGSLGPLALLTSIVWFAPVWVGWEGGSPFARSVGMVVAPFAFALLLHIALAAPRGRLTHRAPVAVTYATAAIVSGGRALTRDPFEDQHCWSNCADNAFLVHADRGLAQTLDSVLVAAALTAGVLVVCVAAWRLARATPTARRMLWPVLVPAGLLGIGESAYAVALLLTPAENPDSAGFAALFVTRAALAIGVASGIAWTVVHARRTQRALARLGAGRQPTASLRETLAAALGDPTLEVAYPLAGRAVDAAGAPVALPSSGGGRAVTSIIRSGEPVAFVGHDATLLEGDTLAREIGAAARLGVDNERLQAAVLARIEDLRASRTRIVEAGDAERRRLERNLHDGAQQRLLALSYELRLARAGAPDDAAALLDQAAEETRAALDELRELAHGIYPAILAEAGLYAALATVSDTAPVPVELGDITPDRHPARVEMAAFLVSVAGIEDAAGHRATHARVHAMRRGAQLIVTVTDDGGDRRATMQHLADRVGALGGELETRPRLLRAVIPCE